MSIERIVKHFKKQDLNSNEIERLVKKAPVLYSDLSKYKSLSQLLGKENYVVILYQTSSRLSGHFVAITKGDNGVVRYFDSYGIPNPDSELQFTPYDKVLPKYLTKLLDSVDYESNRVDYQAKNPAISTCGRYASLACLFRNLSLPQIHEIYKMSKTPYLADSDNLVVLLTLVCLNDIPDYLVDVPRGSLHNYGNISGRPTNAIEKY